MLVTDFDSVIDGIAPSEGIKKALNFLQDKRHRELPDGRMDIDGDRVYALVQSYASRMERDNPTFEAHRRYIDIQYVASGTEILGWAPLDSVTITVPYNEEKDALLGTVPADEWTPVRFTEGQVIVLYPTDAHAPGLAVGRPADIKKVVIKIALES